MSNTTAAIPSTSTSATDWTKELAARRTLPRFRRETEILLTLAPKGATDEQAVKAVDFVRGKLAEAAKIADGKQDFASAGKLGKDGKRNLVLDKAKISVTETIASRLVATKVWAEKSAKELGCKEEEILFPKECTLRTQVEGIFANYGWKA